MDARTLPEQHLTDAFVFEPHLPPQYIDHLELEVVPVPFTWGALARPSPDDMGIEPPGSCLLDRQIAVLEK